MSTRRTMTARHLLLLVGLLGQGWASETIWLPWALPLAGWLGLRYRGKKPLLGDAGETALFGLALFSAYLAAKRYDLPVFVSLGYPLAFLQLLRLSGPMPLRKELFSVGIALVHVAVGALAVFDARFLLLFGATLLLLPSALQELAEAALTRDDPPAGLRIAWKRSLALASLCVVFFTFLPRVKLSPRLPDYAAMPEELDSARGGSDDEGALLFRVRGEALRPLKQYVLDRFDGRRWSRDADGPRLVRRLPRERCEEGEPRRVYPEAPRLFQTALVVDGRVLSVASSDRDEAWLTDVGTVHVPEGFDAGAYEYCIGPKDEGSELSEKERVRYTALPWDSPRLRHFLNTVLNREFEPLGQAEQLATHLRENFEYLLGAPKLNRQNPVEEFVLEERRGHCERFASALAVLLRLEGIPARVVLGYLPVESVRKDMFYAITTKQSHAWTEAWFPGTGWVPLDATPRSDELERDKALVKRALEWVSDFWYQRVVFFDADDHGRFLAETAAELKRLAGALGTDTAELAATAAAVFLTVLLFLRVSRRRGWTIRRRWLRPRGRANRIIEFYGRMLRILSRQGFDRSESQTPLEFCRELGRRGHPRAEEIELVTDRFCALRYGGATLLPEEEQEIAEALTRIRARSR